MSTTISVIQRLTAARRELIRDLEGILSRPDSLAKERDLFQARYQIACTTDHLDHEITMERLARF